MKKTLASKVRAYLKARRALGFQLRVDGYHLLNFARYVDRSGHRGPLTRALALRWACLPKEADRLYWAHRLAIVRTFMQRLAAGEPGTQIPPRHWLGPSRRRPRPHLYTATQLQTLLRRAGALR